MLLVVTGPRNSGKSALAEQAAAGLGPDVVYLATLPNWAVHRDRIRRHREHRPATWPTVELTGGIDDDEMRLAPITGRVVLLDGLATYIGVCLGVAGRETPQARIIDMITELILNLTASNLHVIVVSAEGQDLPPTVRSVTTAVLDRVRDAADRSVKLGRHDGRWTHSHGEKDHCLGG